MTQPKAKGRRAHRQSLEVSGLSFTPAKLDSKGARKGRASTTFTVSTIDSDDPAPLSELLATVQGNALEVVIEPVLADKWKAPARIKGSKLKPPKEALDGVHSILSLDLEVLSDDPGVHLSLFETRLSMDGRDTWDAIISLALSQADFTLLGAESDEPDGTS